MPEKDRNQIDSEGRGRSVAKGDIPERIKRRYFLDERGGPGLGFYVDARIKNASFRDLGGRLTASRTDPNAVQDMVRVAGHRGWSAVAVHGEAAFRREAWLAAMAIGIEARGYRPTERDRQELERRVAQVARRSDRVSLSDNREARDRGDAATMKVVEAVVRDRVSDRPAQERILHAARDRIAGWLERGARLQPVDIAIAADQRDRPRERQRGR